jgi:5'(3')-deoxyribonucleotidase
MKKFDILIDCDGVIINTVKMFVDLNNKLNNQNDKWEDVTDWDFKPCCKNLPTKADVDKLFNHDELYLNPVFFKDCIEVINRLNSKYKIAICTMGESQNIINKIKLLKQYLPQVMIIPIIGFPDNKAFIKCKVMLDDHKKNLISGKFKPILFEPNKRYEWNKGYDGSFVKSWLQFEKVVCGYLENKKL